MTQASDNSEPGVRIRSGKGFAAMLVSDRLQDAYESHVIDNDLDVRDTLAAEFVDGAHELHREDVRHGSATTVAYEVGTRAERLHDALDRMEHDMSPVKQQVEHLCRQLTGIGFVHQWAVEKFGYDIDGRFSIDDAPDNGSAKLYVEAVAPTAADVEKEYEDGTMWYRYVK